MSESKSVKVIAISRGYMDNSIIEEGTKFEYSGPFKMKDGKEVLPQWVKEIKKGKDFSKEELKEAKRDLEMKTDAAALNAQANEVAAQKASLNDLV